MSMTDTQRESYTEIRKRRDELLRRATEAALKGNTPNPDSALMQELRTFEILVERYEKL